MKATPQQDAIYDAVRSARAHLVVEALAGCIAGDAMIGVNRAGKGSRMRLDHVVHMANGGLAGTRRWDPAIATYVRAPHSDGSVCLARLLGASVSGRRPLQEMVLGNGTRLKATADHRILTPGGWVPLCDLSPGVSCVLVDDTGGSAVIGRGRTPKRNYLSRHVPFHPHAVSKGCGIFSVGTHRLNVEAARNGLDLEAYVWRLRTSSDGLEFLNPQLVVHHKDHNHWNNGLDNLEVMTAEEHQHVHLAESLRTIQARLVPVLVVSILPAGEAETFDLAVERAHAFTASGVAVHNSGKTTTAVGCLSQGLGGRVGFVAFNSHIAAELQQRLPPTVPACTLHSLGFAAVRRAAGREYRLMRFRSSLTNANYPLPSACVVLQCLHLPQRALTPHIEKRPPLVPFRLARCG